MQKLQNKILQLRQLKLAVLSVYGTEENDNYNDYIRDGLVFHLDGIDKGPNENAWTDLIGGIILEASSSVIFNYNNTQGRFSNANERLNILAEEGTIEILYKLSSPLMYVDNRIITLGNISDTIGLTIKDKDYISIKQNTYKELCYFFEDDLLKDLSFQQLSLNKDLCVSNSNVQNNAIEGNTFIRSNNIDVGYDSIKIYSVRVYNRLLSKKEMLHNQKVDYKRFINNFGRIISILCANDNAEIVIDDIRNSYNVVPNTSSEIECEPPKDNIELFARWNNSNVIEIDLSNYNLNNVKSMRMAFYLCNALKSLNIGSWDMSKLTDASYAFTLNNNLENLVFGTNCKVSLDFSNSPLSYKSITSVINGLAYLSSGERPKTLTLSDKTYLSLSTDDISFVTRSGWTLVYSESLIGKTIVIDKSPINDDLPIITTVNGIAKEHNIEANNSRIVIYEEPISLKDMFFHEENKNINSINLSEFNTNKVTNLENAFRDLPKLSTLDLSNFDFSNVTNVQNMLKGCTKLSSLTFGKNLQVSMDLSDCPITIENYLKSIFNGLGYVRERQIIKIHKDSFKSCLRLLNDNLIQIANDKNWDIDFYSDSNYYASKNDTTLSFNLNFNNGNYVQHKPSSSYWNVYEFNEEIESLKFFCHNGRIGLIGLNLKYLKISNNAIDITYSFCGYTGTTLILPKMKVSNMEHAFDNMKGIKELDLSMIDISESKNIWTPWTNSTVYDNTVETLDISTWNLSNVNLQTDHICDNLPYLKNLKFGYNLKVSLSFTNSPLLTYESAISIINGLAEQNIVENIHFANETYSLLSDEDIALAANKGWNIISPATINTNYILVTSPNNTIDIIINGITKTYNITPNTSSKIHIRGNIDTLSFPKQNISTIDLTNINLSNISSDFRNIYISNEQAVQIINNLVELEEPKNIIFSDISLLSDKDIALAANKGWNIEIIESGRIFEAKSSKSSFDVYINDKKVTYYTDDSKDYKKYAITEQITSLKNFYNNNTVDGFKLHNLKINNIISIQNAFSGTFNELTLPKMKVSSIMSAFFTNYGTNGPLELDLTMIDVSNIEDQYLDVPRNNTRLITLDISNWDLSNLYQNTYFNSVPFYNLTSLQNLKFGYNCNTSISFENSPLSYESALSVINGLAEIDNKKTITFKSVTYNTLTEDEIAMATSKGWTIAKKY